MDEVRESFNELSKEEGIYLGKWGCPCNHLTFDPRTMQSNALTQDS